MFGIEFYLFHSMLALFFLLFLLNDTATTEIYTGTVVGSVRCV